MIKCSIQYRWEVRRAVRPAIRMAAEVMGPYPNRVGRMNPLNWVVDYEFTHHGRTRVNAPRAHWRERGPRTAHLYPQRSLFWEDPRGLSGRRHTAWINFAGGAGTGLERLIDPEYGYAHFLDPGGRAGACFRRAASVGQDLGEQGFWKAQGALAEIIDLLLQAEHVGAEVYRIAAEDLLPGRGLGQTVRRYLARHLSEKVRLRDVARDAGVSVSTLAHRYPAESGETVMRTLTRLRIEHTKALLLRGQPLKTIADQLDFSSPFHLSKTFKRVEGLSPRAFVKALARE